MSPVSVKSESFIDVFSTSSSNGSSPAPNSDRSCVICGEYAKCRHHGATCCDACAAFFKRTMLAPKDYHCKCRRENAKKSIRKSLCRYCRLIRCLRAGLKVTGIEACTTVDEIQEMYLVGDSPFRSVILRRNTLFINRIRRLMDFGFYEGTHRPTTQNVLETVYSTIELNLLRGLLYQFDDARQRISSDISIDAFTQHFFVIWMTFETMLSTMRNASYARNVVTCIDGSSFEISTEWLEDFCRNELEIKDPAGCVR
ncbi:hepatocyte nuclear factor 4-alpha isoform e [Aphelenchoides avenae]|nr:hepatocyte nuclear factor 4-alpha isoform e [Aphelenchus avenae]